MGRPPTAKSEFVRQHLDKTDAEISELSQTGDADLAMTANAAYQCRKRIAAADAAHGGGGRRKKPPERGDKRAFVAKHFKKPNAEIAALSEAAGLVMTKDAVSQHRGVIKAGGGPANYLGLDKKQPAAKRAPKRTPSNGHVKPAAPAAISGSGKMSAKESTLRKLFFEAGFDLVRRVYLEFEEMHQSMKG